MKELYWLITLGSLGEALSIIATTAGVLLVTILIAGTIAWPDIKEEDKPLYKKRAKIAWIIWGIATLIAIAIPSKEQLYIIYGVGGTIDYIKENPTAKQLPDKCIKVLDKWADEQLKNEK